MVVLWSNMLRMMIKLFLDLEGKIVKIDFKYLILWVGYWIEWEEENLDICYVGLDNLLKFFFNLEIYGFII